MSAPAYTEDSECDDFGMTCCDCHCMQPVMIAPRAAQTTAMKKFVLMNPAQRTPGRYRLRVRPRVRTRPHHVLSGIARPVPQVIAQWVNVRRGQLEIVPSETVLLAPQVTDLLQTVHHGRQVTDQSGIVNLSVTVRIPHALLVNVLQ